MSQNQNMDDFFGNVGIENARVRGGGDDVRPGRHLLKCHAIKADTSQQGKGKYIAVEFDVVTSEGKAEDCTALGFGLIESKPHTVGERVSTIYFLEGQHAKTYMDSLLTVLVALKESMCLTAEADPTLDLVADFKAQGVDLTTRGCTKAELAKFCSETQPLEGVHVWCRGKTIKTKGRGERFTDLAWQGVSDQDADKTKAEWEAAKAA